MGQSLMASTVETSPAAEAPAGENFRPIVVPAGIVAVVAIATSAAALIKFDLSARAFRSGRSSCSARLSPYSSRRVAIPAGIGRSTGKAAPSWRDRLTNSKVRHLGSGIVGATFWLLFAYSNIRDSIDSGRVIGAGVGLL